MPPAWRSALRALQSRSTSSDVKVNALAEEHQRLAQENGANSRAAQDAEIKLNKETETLNKMQRELDDTQEASLQGMTEEEKNAGEAAEDLGDQVDDSGNKMERFQGVLGGIGKIVAGVVVALAALAAAAIAAAVGIGKIVFDAAEAAGELVDLSTQTGISTTRLQELKYAGDQVGTSLETITGSQAKLVRSMDTAQEQGPGLCQKIARCQGGRQGYRRYRDGRCSQSLPAAGCGCGRWQRPSP